MVQCKHWKAFNVGVTTVRELYGVMAAKGASSGFAVTSGRFTSEAHEFEAERNIEFAGGEALMRLLQYGRAHKAAPPSRTARGAPSRWCCE